MDFKVAGTEVGVTALQMDIKIKGVTREILHDALKQANVARAQIREVMSKAIAEPRKELSKYAPKFESFQIDKDKIKDVIGTGGKDEDSRCHCFCDTGIFLWYERQDENSA